MLAISLALALSCHDGGPRTSAGADTIPLTLQSVSTPTQRPEIRLTFDRPIDPTSLGSHAIELWSTARVPFVADVQKTTIVLRPVPVRDDTGRFRPSFEPLVRYELRLRSGASALRGTDRSALAKSIARPVTLPLEAFARRGDAIEVTWSRLEKDGTQRPLDGARGVNLEQPILVTFHELMAFEQLVDPVTRRSTSVRFESDADGLMTTVDDRKPIEADVFLVPELDAGRTYLLVQLRASVTSSIVGTIDGGLNDLTGNPAGTFASIVFWPRGASTAGRRELVEAFDDNAQEDAPRTAAYWNVNGSSVLEQGPGGSSGMHGDFMPTSSVTLHTNSATFPGTDTLTGRTERVTNGVFRFANFVIPAGVTVQMTGNQIAQIYATNVDIQGTLLVAGEDAPTHMGVNNPCLPGLPWIPNGTGLGGRAGIGGPGAGEGGSGGDDPRPMGVAPNGAPRTMDPLHVDGRDAEGIDGRIGRASGGGAGSPAHPLTSISSDPAVRLANVSLAAFLNYSLQRSGGGGGGSNATMGTTGQQGERTGLGGPGGLAGFVPNADRTVPRTSRGGAGGGGGGVHSFFTNQIAARLAQCPPSYNPKPLLQGRPVMEIWNTGSGGGGGGGCAILQAGRQLQVTGHVDASGGDGGLTRASSPAQTSESAAGGGGSGGNVRVEAGRTLSLPNAGVLDVAGGVGGRSRLPSAGGDGGAGYVHVRSNPPISAMEATQASNPPTSASVGTYVETDYDNLSRATSKWYLASQGRPMRYVDFRVEYAVGPPGADPNDPNQVRWLTIDGSSSWPTYPNGAFHVFFQGANDDGMGNPSPGTSTRWVDSPASLPGNADLVRFAVVFNRSQSARDQVLAIRDVRIVIED